MEVRLLRSSTRALRPSMMQGNRSNIVPFSFPFPLHFYGNDTGRTCDDFEDLRKDARDNYAATEAIRLDGMASLVNDDRSRAFHMGHYGTTPYSDICRSVSASVWGVGVAHLDGKPLWDVYPELKFVPDESSPEISRDLAKTIRDNAQHPFRKAAASGRTWLTPANYRMRFLAKQKAPVIGKAETNEQGRDWRTLTHGEAWYMTWSYHALALKGKLSARKRVQSNSVDYFHKGTPVRVRMGGNINPEYDKFHFYATIGPEFTTYGVNPRSRVSWNGYFFITVCIYMFLPLCFFMLWSDLVWRRNETQGWSPAHNTTWGASVYPSYGGQYPRARFITFLTEGPYKRTSQLGRQ